jgi:hypothetical protein
VDRGEIETVIETPKQHDIQGTDEHITMDGPQDNPIIEDDQGIEVDIVPDDKQEMAPAPIQETIEAARTPPTIA